MCQEKLCTDGGEDKYTELVLAVSRYDDRLKLVVHQYPGGHPNIKADVSFLALGTEPTTSRHDVEDLPHARFKLNTFKYNLSTLDVVAEVDQDSERVTFKVTDHIDSEYTTLTLPFDMLGVKGRDQSNSKEWTLQTEVVDTRLRQ